MRLRLNGHLVTALVLINESLRDLNEVYKSLQVIFCNYHILMNAESGVLPMPHLVDNILGYFIAFKK